MASTESTSSRYFANLNYSIGDEDTTVEHSIAETHRPRTVAVVAGSGARVLPLLAFSPLRVWVVDCSVEQLAMAELRISAARMLEREEYCSFMGYPSISMTPSARQSLFEALPLSPAARPALSALLQQDGWREPIYLGRFENMLRRFSRLISPVLGRAAEELFTFDTIEAQREFVQTRFPRRRWSALVRILGTATALNSILYRGSFPPPNTGVSPSQSFARSFERLFQQVLARRSFFLQMLLLGRIRYAEGIPLEGTPAVYPLIKAGLSGADLCLRQADVMSPQSYAPQPIDLFSLSDVPSFLPAPQDMEFLSRLAPALSDSGIVISRGCLRIATPREDGFANVTAHHEEAFANESTQLWTIQVYQRSGRAGHDVPTYLAHMGHTDVHPAAI